MNIEIEFDSSKFHTQAEWRRVMFQLNQMDKETAMRIIAKHGYKLVEQVCEDKGVME